MPIQRHATFPKVLAALIFSFGAFVFGPFFIFYRAFITGYKTVVPTVSDPLSTKKKNETTERLEGVLNGTLLSIFLLPLLAVPGLVISSYLGAELGYKKGFKWGFLTIAEKIFPPLKKKIDELKDQEMNDLGRKVLELRGKACANLNKQETKKVVTKCTNVIISLESLYEEDIQVRKNQTETGPQDLLKSYHTHLTALRDKLIKDLKESHQMTKNLPGESKTTANSNFTAITQQLMAAEPKATAAPLNPLVETENKTLDPKSSESCSINNAPFWAKSQAEQKPQPHKSQITHCVEKVKEWLSELSTKLSL